MQKVKQKYINLRLKTIKKVVGLICSVYMCCVLCTNTYKRGLKHTQTQQTQLSGLLFVTNNKILVVDRRVLPPIFCC